MSHMCCLRFAIMKGISVTQSVYSVHTAERAAVVSGVTKQYSGKQLFYYYNSIIQGDPKSSYIRININCLKSTGLFNIFGPNLVEIMY